VERKDTNPKDLASVDRIPMLSVLPPDALKHLALAHACGAAKYGALNWRTAGARREVYLDAAMRHILRYWADGALFDPESGAHHLAHAAASLLVLVDADLIGVSSGCSPHLDGRGGGVYAKSVDRVEKLYRSFVERKEEE